MDAIAALDGLMSRVRELVAARGAHPARTIVLLPFVHLLQPAREAWARLAPDGFSPRFETTGTLARESAFVPGPEDCTGDLARDLLLAHSLIERAGLGAHARLLAPRLVEAAMQLQPIACAIATDQRRGWAARARQVTGFDAPVFSHESAIATIAIEWVAASSFHTDRLLDESFAREIDLLVVAQGLRQDALADAIAARMGARAQVLPLPLPREHGAIALHEAADPAEEAERAAACVLDHVREQRTPVALVAVDRILTRRIRAMLEQGNAAIRDETGWTLSTTRAAAHVMLALRACAWNAGADAVIDWMKNSPAHADASVLAIERRIRRAAAHVMLALRACAWNAGADAVIDWMKNSPAHADASVLAIERRIRRAGIREWRTLRDADLAEGLLALSQKVNTWREDMQGVRSLPQWLEALRDLLRAGGSWEALEQDAAGMQVLSALRLSEFERAEFDGFAPAGRRLTLAEFTAWTADVLESQSFVPPSAGNAQVVILPLHQAVARDFAAIVIPGCDETRLQASPDPAGVWTEAQRKALGLPTRAMLEAETREAWRHALQAAACDIVWRSADENGEPVLASVLVQQLQLEGIAKNGEDPRAVRSVHIARVDRPQPAGAMLPLERLSASAYEDLRRCPYRFFALRQLGLQEPDEIDVDLDKRDFGNWLHKVLSTFHDALAADVRADKERLLEDAAQSVTRAMRLDEGEFLPFRAAWPQVRRGYLAWLAKHEAENGASFEESEGEHECALGRLTLFGRIDRVDRLAGGARMVMDYKTEGLQTTQDRVRHAGEDTQLAFYAALLGQDDLRAAYVNVGERGETKAVEQPDVIAARDMLLAGIVHDAQRIAQGVPLPALGEGKACEYCAARGLCRKDFWA